MIATFNLSSKQESATKHVNVAPKRLYQVTIEVTIDPAIHGQCKNIQDGIKFFVEYPDDPENNNQALEGYRLLRGGQKFVFLPSLPGTHTHTLTVQASSKSPKLHLGFILESVSQAKIVVTKIARADHETASFTLKEATRHVEQELERRRLVRGLKTTSLKPAQISARKHDKAHILLIEDGSYIAKNWHRFLLSLGYMVTRIQYGGNITFDTQLNDETLLKSPRAYVPGNTTVYPHLSDAFSQTSAPTFSFAIGDLQTCETAATVADLFQIPYVYHPKTVEYLHYTEQPILCSAMTLVAEHKDKAAKISSANMAPVTICKTPDNGSSETNQSAAGIIEDLVAYAIKISKKPRLTRLRGDAQRILILSYYWAPLNSVAINRVKYWADYISEASNGKLTPTVATATSQFGTSNSNSVLWIPDSGMSTLDASASLKLQDVALRRVGISTHGLSWKNALEQYFTKHKNFKFDHVLMSGNPFLNFHFSEFAKANWGASVSLDYRDTFAHNPRINRPDEVIEILEDIEIGFANAADNVFAVDQRVGGHNMPAAAQPKLTVIPNGYNEIIIDAVEAKQAHSNISKFCYAGRFYDLYGLPDLFADELAKTNSELHYYGNEPSSVFGINQDAVIMHKQMPYEGLVEQMKTMNAGLIFCSGAPDEFMTKLYDYIGCDLDIIMLHTNDIEEGLFTDATNQLERCYWVRNERTAIQDFLRTYKPSTKPTEPAKMRFSRRFGLEKLIKAIGVEITNEA